MTKPYAYMAPQALGTRSHPGPHEQLNQMQWAYQLAGALSTVMLPADCEMPSEEIKVIVDAYLNVPPN